MVTQKEINEYVMQHPCNLTSYGKLIAEKLEAEKAKAAKKPKAKKVVVETDGEEV